MRHPIIKDLNRRYTAKKYDATKRIPPEDMAVIKDALGGYLCEIGLALGYHLQGQGVDKGLPKARLAMEDVVIVL